MSATKLHLDFFAVLRRGELLWRGFASCKHDAYARAQSASCLGHIGLCEVVGPLSVEHQLRREVAS